MPTVAVSKHEEADRPAIEPGAIYTRQQVQKNLHVGCDTFAFWLDNGLRVVQPGTKSMFVLSDDLLKFLAEYKPQRRPKTYTEKQASRAGRVKDVTKCQ